MCSMCNNDASFLSPLFDEGRPSPPGQAPSWRENDLYPWRTSSKQQFLAYTIVTNTSIYIDCVRIPFGIVQRQQIK